MCQYAGCQNPENRRQLRGILDLLRTSAAKYLSLCSASENGSADRFCSPCLFDHCPATTANLNFSEFAVAAGQNWRRMCELRAGKHMS
jgi:hypothetical protein